jgi:serine/threonine-protein phosphatase PP1 catalytic subunit
MGEEDRLERLIRRLFAASKLPRDSHVRLDIEDLFWLCESAIECLKLDPVLLHLRAPLSICGDLHGQFYDLLEFFKIGGRPPSTNYLFLGDYVDRGHNSVEVFSLLLALKVRHPRNVWLLRGNHESAGIAQIYGFFSECALLYSQSLWGAFTAVFEWLPFVAVIDDRILCLHGGLSPEMVDIGQLECVKRPVAIPAHGMLNDIVWADSCDDHPNFMPSLHGTSYTYGPDVTDMFMQSHGFELICRGHQVVPSGFDFPFRPNCGVLTVFSAPNYCGNFGNLGAMLQVDRNLKCSFEFVAAPEGS